MESEQNKLVYAQKEPDIAELVKEYQRCSPYSWGWNRLLDNENTRFCRWANQSTDGKKHATENEPAFPWEGASDSQPFLVDTVINENVAVLSMAFHRSMAVAKGVEPQDYETAANVTKLLEWLAGTKMQGELLREVELAAQYRETYGLFVLHPFWDRDVELESTPMTLEKLSQIAEQSPLESPIRLLPILINDPETEDQAVALVQEFGKLSAQMKARAQLGEEPSPLFDNYEVKPATARRFVRELRSGKQSSLPIPYVCKNQPSIRVLKPWYDVFIPPYVTDLQNASVIFVKNWYTEQQLRSKAAMEGWDQEWVDEAVKRGGKSSTWTGNSVSDGLTWSSTTTTVTGNDTSFTWLEEDQTDHNQIEVLCAYTSELDQDDVPCKYYTIFHADITKTADGTAALYAKRDKLGYDHKKLPFVLGMRERWNRSLVSSRGVPQILSSRQREVKVQRDSIVDATSLTVSPPILQPDRAIGGKFVFAPNRTNIVQPGREPKQMELQAPGASIALELMERFQQEIKEEMGVMDEGVAPARSQMKQQMMVNGFLGAWTEAFQQTFALVAQFMPEQMVMEITGSQVPLPKGNLIALQKDFILSFDVRQLDNEHVVKQFDAITKGVVPHDREGVISSSKLVRAMLRAIDPALAKEITLDGNQASQQLIQRVDQDFISMFAGNQPRLTPDDNPTAQAEVQIAQQLLQNNQKYQQAMMQDPDFSEKVKQWFENRLFNVQQDKNAMTGRTGVEAA